MSAHSQLPVTLVLESRTPSSLCEHLHTSGHTHSCIHNFKKGKTQKDAGWIFVVHFRSRSKFRVRIVLFGDGVYISSFSVAVIKCVFYHAMATYRRKCSFGLRSRGIGSIMWGGVGGGAGSVIASSRHGGWSRSRGLRSRATSKPESKFPRNGSHL